MTDSLHSHQDHVNGLFVKHSPRIRGFVLSILPNMSRADDVMQETFLTIAAKSDEFVRGTNFVAWACRVAQLKVLEDCRRQGKNACCLSPEVIEAVCLVHSPEPQDVRDEQLVALQKCLDSLAPHTRRAIDLRYVRAHKAGEIARLLGWTTESVYVVLSRARDVLQDCIDTRLAGQNDGH
ncbi:RNA polymerase sigma factor CarQ [Rubripirellula lacrimiformis]|uniref:RNA polymerase sigma factor CarQ n=1 Tax=Rubripirellula lacrimiformis TaxID=1930273 RepID=A0A517N4B0_9BACT|nr:sigma-70 family RNA polymerase sigma factor [Rubripirellula lacrimiformis]QDT01975.1 RNA polymerase sigma factor CarQ [Rubripirellula lacrimiformis]